jgi:hypothetical protein
MHPRPVFVDLPKDRRPEVYRFRPPRREAKGGGGAFHLLGKSKLSSRKNAHRRCGILRRSKPSSTSVKVNCPKLVTDLGRPRFDVVETEVTHGRGTPLMSRSPAFPSTRTGTEFQSRKTLRAVARPGGPGPLLPCGASQEYSGGAERTRGATLVSDGGPVQSGLVSVSPSRIVELFHFGRGECAIVEACRPYRRCELR